MKKEIIKTEAELLVEAATKLYDTRGSWAVRDPEGYERMLRACRDLRTNTKVERALRKFKGCVAFSVIALLCSAALTGCGDNVRMSAYCPQGTMLTADMHCQVVKESK